MIIITFLLIGAISLIAYFAEKRNKGVLEFKSKISVFKEGELTQQEIDELWDKHTKQ